MNHRPELSGAVTLYAESGGTVFQREFFITKTISSGASVICYEAHHKDSSRGTLKEFFPLDCMSLSRDSSGQVYSDPRYKTAHEKYLRARADYEDTYRRLLVAKQDPACPDLATFLPTFELYRGAGDGTVYIWSPEPELETFDKICRQIRRHPQKTPEKNLVTVLTAIETLTKCIQTLHIQSFLHRDIKPANFGFLRRGNETLTQAISLFDINSICSVFDPNTDILGTEGYLEPEREPASNQTDIYAIGATLFEAVVVCEETEKTDGRWRQEYHSRLRELVDHSALIRASEANSHPRLRNLLTKILTKCLDYRSLRYAGCEELLEDLDAALFYALPSEFARKRQQGKKWVLTDCEKSLDKHREKNSELALHYHLYAHPLYRSCPPEELELRVLILGMGNYGQKFLDACLQNGQIRGKTLSVTAVSHDETDSALYLEPRPELQKFFSVNGAELTGEAYGSVNFETATLYRSSSQGTPLQQTLQALCEKTRPHYVFIALGEDALNLAAARACRKGLKAAALESPVSYVLEEDDAAEQSGMLCPLCIHRQVTRLPMHPHIQRMAFNTHLAWDSSAEPDFAALRAEFRKPYYHDSCVSNVLSLKYKLFSMGIDLDTTDFSQAAEAFTQALCGEGGAQLRHELTWIEHRRWVTEKLCLGWRQLENVEECMGRSTRDDKGKRHPCLVRSRPDGRLAQLPLEAWDTATPEELAQLDELDRLSVNFHRLYLRRATEARRQNLLSGSAMASIRTLAGGSSAATVAFLEWQACLRDIWNGDSAKVALYDPLMAAFLRAADALKKEQREALEKQVGVFDALFYPIVAALQHKSWKENDVTLINHIPFVLTYSAKACLAVPFSAGDNCRMFGNVAAVTVVKPADVLYFYRLQSSEDVSALQQAAACTLQFMDKKNLPTAVEFFLLCTPETKRLASRELADALKAQSSRVRSIRVICAGSEEELGQALANALRSRAAARELFACEKNETALSGLLTGAGFYRQFPAYRFRAADMTFTALSGCPALGYIRKMPAITVADMTAFSRSFSVKSDPPEFFEDYQSLWARYTENPGLWKLLCTVLSDYTESRDTLAVLKKKQQWEKAAAVRRRYLLPAVCRESAAKIVKFLLAQELLEEGSRVGGYTTDACEVILQDCCDYGSEYDALFSRVYTLMQPDALSLYANPKRREVCLRFDSLTVEALSIAGGKAESLASLLEFFRRKSYLLGLTVTREFSVSFTFASRQIKHLLTTAGKILEVYTFHKAKELGAFSDVAGSYEISWEGSDVTSEADCILTKGFRSLFVECKAKPDIQQDTYYKLRALADQFGIHATAVLIADTRERSSHEIAPINDMQRSRGAMMDIVTIWKPEDIENIGQTLLGLITKKED